MIPKNRLDLNSVFSFLEATALRRVCWRCQTSRTILRMPDKHDQLCMIDQLDMVDQGDELAMTAHSKDWNSPQAAD